MAEDLFGDVARDARTLAIEYRTLEQRHPALARCRVILEREREPGDVRERIGAPDELHRRHRRAIDDELVVAAMHEPDPFELDDVGEPRATRRAGAEISRPDPGVGRPGADVGRPCVEAVRSRTDVGRSCAGIGRS